MGDQGLGSSLSPSHGHAILWGVPRPIRIEVGDIILDAELFDTASALTLYDALPFRGPFDTWGDEFYFPVPVVLGSDETATTNVQVGDIGYWPPGQALAIFFGPTPLSDGTDPVAASEVNVVGRILGNVRLLAQATEEMLIQVSAV